MRARLASAELTAAQSTATPARHPGRISEGMRYVMGTILKVRTAGTNESSASRAKEEIFEEIQFLESLLSVFRPESEISRINRAAGLAPTRVSPSTFTAVEQALRYAEMTSGAFEPVMAKPLSERTSPHASSQGFGPNYKQAFTNGSRQEIYLLHSDLSLDLGGFAKGYALDSALRRALRLPGIESVFMDFGGQLLFWSRIPSQEPIDIGIEDPENRDRLLGRFQIRSNGSVSTSSHAERNGHIVDPRQGKPAVGMKSATVFAPSGAQAESWSTAFFVGKPEERSHWLEMYPEIRAFLWPSRH